MITLRLDKNGGINKGDIKAFEHDNLSETYIIQLYKNGKVYDLTNKTIELTMVEKKRKTGDIVNLPIYNATEGKVKLEVVSDITKQDGTYDFKITIKGLNGLIETFPNFQVKIKNDITDSITGEIIQDPKFTILVDGLKALADYNIYKENALKVPDIENGIVELGEQLDNKASKQEVDVERKRIDSLSKLEEGSTTGDAELIDGRISQNGVIFDNIGGNIRNIDNLTNTVLLQYETLIDANYEELTALRDENGTLYIKYNIKEGDILEFVSECVGNHSFTLTTTIPLNRAYDYSEVINTTGDIKTKRVISTGNYSGIFIWAKDVTQLRKVSIKKINMNDGILKKSKIGILDNFFNRKTIFNDEISDFVNNIKYLPMKIEKGKYYRINVFSKVKNKYSIFISANESKERSSVDLVSDVTENTEDLIITSPATYNYLAVYEEKSTNNNLHLIVEEIEFSDNHKGISERTIFIAASDSSDFFKDSADFICTGTNDEDIINKAIDLLPYGGVIQLFDGNYYFDEFSSMNNSCVFFKNSGYGRTITIKGTTENKSFLSNYGVVIHVTEKAHNALSDSTTYSVFNATSERVPIYNHDAYPNNVNFENFYLFLWDSNKKIVGINGSNMGSMEVKQVGVYNRLYFYYRFNRIRPTTPVEGCIGILSVKGANDEMARISMDCANAGGLWCGITIKGVEHLIMNTCTSSRNVYGYEFVGRCDKTLTVLNCADEGNRHLPIFKNTGSATIIDFCIERLHDDVIPYDPNGSTEPFATEDTTNGWKGFLSYRIQGNALGVNKFWKNGHGRGFKTVNLDNNISGSTRPTNPDYLCEFFDTTTNKLLIWNGLNWVDSMGNIIE